VHAQTDLAEEGQVEKNLEGLGVSRHDNELGNAAVQRLGRCRCVRAMCRERERAREAERKRGRERERERE
jgi:hypothetical protein